HCAARWRRPMASYLERYRAGEHEAVWAELLAEGERVRAEPLSSDALAVARETMGRVRHNLELLVERLRALGYEFAEPQQVLTPPDEELLGTLRALEAKAGPLPLALRVFYEMVGSVNLMGSHPTLSAYTGAPELGAMLGSVGEAFRRHMGTPATPAQLPPELAGKLGQFPPEVLARLGQAQGLIQALMGGIRAIPEEMG